MSIKSAFVVGFAGADAKRRTERNIVCSSEIEGSLSYCILITGWFVIGLTLTLTCRVLIPRHVIVGHGIPKYFRLPAVEHQVRSEKMAP